MLDRCKCYLFSFVTPVYSLHYCVILFSWFNKLNDDDDDDDGDGENFLTNLTEKGFCKSVYVWRICAQKSSVLFLTRTVEGDIVGRRQKQRRRTVVNWIPSSEHGR